MVQIDSIFRAALDGMSQGVVICDLQGIVQYINPAAESLAGQALAGGMSWSDLLYSVLGEEGLKNVRDALAQGSDKSFHLRGRQSLFRLTTSTLRSGGSLLGYMISAEERPLQDRCCTESEIEPLRWQVEFILGATGTGLDIIDSEFNLRYIDPEWKRAYGDFQGRKCYEYFYGRDSVCPGCGAERALETRKAAVTEGVLLREGNRPVQIISMPYQDESGAWLVAEVHVDISERRRVEEEIRMRDRFLAGVAVATSQLLTTADSTFAINQALEIVGSAADADRAYIFENQVQGDLRPASLRYEWSRDQSRSRLGRPGMDKLYHDSISAGWCEALAGNRPVNGLSRDFPGPERERLEAMGIMSILMVPVMVEGHFWGFIGLDDCSKERKWTWSETSILLAVAGSIGGIIARENAYDQLRSAHQKLLSIIEFLPDATFVVDKEKRVIAWNRAIEEMTGTRKEEVMGKGDFAYALPFYGQSIPMLVDLIENSDPELESRYQYLERRGDTLYGEVFVPSLGGGSGAFLWAKASPLIDDQGRLIGSIESLRDITDRKTAEKELQRSEKRYKEMAELLPQPVFETDICGRITFVNRRAFDYFGYDPSVLEGGFPVTDVVIPEERPVAMENALKLLQGANASCIEYTAQRRDGSTFPVLVYSSPIIQEGRVLGLRGVLVDITERKKMEEALRETRDYLESLIDNASAPIIVWNPFFKITRFNHASERLVGRSSEEVIGMPLEMLFPDVSRAESMAHIQRTLSGERWEAVEIPVQRMDGTVRIVLWNSSAIYNKDGTAVVATIAQGQDITERTLAENEVRRLTKALDTMPSGIILSDLEGKIEYINQGFIDLSSCYDKSEIVGHYIHSFIDERGSKLIDEEIVPMLTSAGHWRGEISVRKGDGSLFTAEALSSMVTDERGNQSYVIASLNDISMRKLMEAELVKAKEAAEAADQAKSEFLANISHEIRTPLNAIIGMTGLMLDTSLTQEQREYVETVRTCGDSLLEIISDILDFSRIEDGGMKLERQPFNLNECLNASIDLVSAEASRKDLGLSYSIDPQVPRVIVGDVTRLRQVLVNLMGNSVKFTECGEISVHVSREDEEILFTVEDTGIGISEDSLGKLFQSFSQIDASATRRYGGAGLGLAISKRLVEMMGGRIWAESSPGQGSIFSFTIIAEGADSGSSACFEPELAGGKVLAVGQDTGPVSDLLRSWSMLPFEALSALDGLGKLGLERFDALIVDAGITDLGILVAEAGKRRNLPVIVLASREEDLEGLEFSAAIAKPVDASALHNAVVSIFCAKERPRTPAPARPVDPAMGVIRPLRILVVEDNLVNQKVALRMLERMGYRADIASNGLESLQILERLHYDLVLMDVQMPEMDGLEATSRIRKRGGRQPYIIAMTAHALEGDRERCLQAGMDDYISKPVKIAELQSAIEACMERMGPGPALDQEAIACLRELQMDGEPDIIEELGSLFLDRVPVRIKSMQEAFERGDSEMLRSEAHNLKSSSANVGAMRLSSIAREIEALGRSGDLTRASSLIYEAHEELERVREALEEEMKRSV